MDAFEINNYLEVISFIKEKCISEIKCNKKINSESDFFNKYCFLDSFNSKFKTKKMFDNYDINNDKYQKIIKYLCPKINLESINKKKKFKNMFEYSLTISLFLCLFSNEFYIIYIYNSRTKNQSLNELYNKQEETINELTNKVNRLTIDDDAVDNLNVLLEKTKSEYNTKFEQVEYIINNKEFYIDNVPIINQHPDYPSGCESISLLILLKNAGVDVTANQIVDKLIKAQRPYKVNNNLYGNDPEVYFIGNPADIYGYGVYEKPIISVASSFKSGIKDLTGSSLNEVLKVVIQKHPVQVWVAMDGISTYYYRSWIDELSGKTIYYPAEFHSLVIIGFNKRQIITSDPSVGAVRYFDRENFENSFNFFGKRAIYYE